MVIHLINSNASNNYIDFWLVADDVIINEGFSSS